MLASRAPAGLRKPASWLRNGRSPVRLELLLQPILSVFRIIGVISANGFIVAGAAAAGRGRMILGWIIRVIPPRGFIVAGAAATGCGRMILGWIIRVIPPRGFIVSGAATAGCGRTILGRIVRVIPP